MVVVVVALAVVSEVVGLLIQWVGEIEPLVEGSLKVIYAVQYIPVC